MESNNDLSFGVWILIALYIPLVLYFVVRGAKQTKSVKDYAVGSIVFSPWAVGLSLAATMTSAATFIINPGFIAYYGLSAVISFVITVPLGAILSLVVLTKTFRKVGIQIKALTIADWIGERYNNKSYAFFFGIVSLLLITFIVLICVGITKLLSLTLGINELWILIAVVVFIFGYMMMGGANSMVYTNTIQAIVMIVVAVMLLSSGTEHFSTGITGFISKLKDIDSNLAKPFNPNSYFFRDAFEVIFCQIIVGIAIVCQPHIITKSLLLKKNSDVNKYLFSGVTIQILFFLVVITGLYARLTFPDLTYNGAPLKLDSVMSIYVIQTFSSFAGVLVVMGLLSAGISTLEGLIQTISTTITKDLLVPIRERLKLPEFRSEIAVNRWVIVSLAVVTILLSYQQLKFPDLSVAIFAQNGVYAFFSSAFVPVLLGSFFKKIPVYIPFSASVVALIVHFGMYYGRIGSYMQLTVRNPGIPSAMAILTSTGLALFLILLYNLQNRKSRSPND
ncbi:MAG: sodium:solute symporter [Cyclobacteriaceae bacterium]|nr:sodium:solute symporter [Cyclobacteriaceae bacterium]